METPLNLTRPEGAQPRDFHLSRRGVAGLFFFGYAAAVSPVNAEAITTPDTGLFTKNLTIRRCTTRAATRSRPLSPCRPHPASTR